MSDCSNLIDVEIYLDFFLPLNEGNDDPPIVIILNLSQIFLVSQNL